MACRNSGSKGSRGDDFFSDPPPFDGFQQKVISCEPKMTLSRTTNGLAIQGLLNVPFWVYWTSPYSSHYRPYT